MNKRGVCCALFVLVGCWQVAYSKGSPDKIIIKVAGVSDKTEITDRTTLKGFDPWSGQFIDWPKGIVANSPAGDATYEVFFYIRWKPTDRHLRLFYIFRYIPGRNGERGYVYLPGESDKWGSVSRGTILRDGDDGHWHYASTAWDTLMERLILLHRASQT